MRFVPKRRAVTEERSDLSQTVILRNSLLEAVTEYPREALFHCGRKRVLYLLLYNGVFVKAGRVGL